MKSLKPPNTATWLLNKFGYGSEPLAGDLLEEFNQGRSAGWYWRQVLVAVAVGLAKEVRGHKLLALRALATGWTTWYLLYYVAMIPLFRFYNKVLLAHGVTHTSYDIYPTLLVVCIHSAASGWVVGRCHRRYRGAMVLVYLVSCQLLFLPEFFRLIVDAFGDRRFLPYLLWQFLQFTFLTAGVLLGGFWNAETYATRRSTSR